jgi:hypothetical protein
MVEMSGANFPDVCKMKKVSSVSRARKLEEVCGIGGAKLMKPFSLN